MKVLLISDIHANWPALQAVAAAEPDAELTVFAGDMVDFGYHPHEVITWFRERECICVAGNHDHEVLDRLAAGLDKPAEGELPNYAQYNLAHMTAEDLDYLAALPDEARFEIDGVAYYMAHFVGKGDRKSEECFERKFLSMEYVPAFEKLWREKCPGVTAPNGRRVILGHSHRSVMLRRGGDSMVLNPGAVGYQLGPDCLFATGADYMVIQDGEVMPRHVEYDGSVIRELVHTVPLCEQARRTADGIFHTHLFAERREQELADYLGRFTLIDQAE